MPSAVLLSSCDQNRYLLLGHRLIFGLCNVFNIAMGQPYPFSPFLFILIFVDFYLLRTYIFLLTTRDEASKSFILPENVLELDGHILTLEACERGVFLFYVRAKIKFQFLARPVYELLERKGLGIGEVPKQETALINGDIAFHQHAESLTIGIN